MKKQKKKKSTVKMIVDKNVRDKCYPMISRYIAIRLKDYILSHI